MIEGGSPLLTEQNWYSNKEIFEMFQELTKDIATLRQEMAETRTIIRDYNCLREKLEETNKLANDTASKVATLMWTTPVAVAAIGLIFTVLNYILK